MLASMFIPLERIVTPVPGTNTPRLVAENKVSEEMIGFMKMIFFVASLILAVKTFLIFCFGFLQEPRVGEIFRDASADDDEQHPMLLHPASKDFDAEPTNPLA